MCTIMSKLPERPIEYHIAMMYIANIQDFHARKLARKVLYETWIKGWKLETCRACSGSGFYDNSESPQCGACNGTGRQWYKPKSLDK